MSEQTETQAAPSISERVAGNEAVSETKEQTRLSSGDILKKAQETASEKAQEQKKDPLASDVDIPDRLYSEEDLASIRDPIARQMTKEILDKKEKDMLRGMHKKFEEIASIRKELQEAKGSQQNSWSPDKIDELLKNKEFVDSVQAYAQSHQTQPAPSTFDGTPDEWSALSENEQKRLLALENEIKSMRGEQQKLHIQQADERIRERLPGYDPTRVDEFQQNLNSYSTEQLREAIGKFLLFDESLERAYELGLKDRDTSLNEKYNANSNVKGTGIPAGTEILRRQDGEKSSSHFKRIAFENLKKALGGATR